MYFQDYENSPHVHKYSTRVATTSCRSLGPVQRVLQEEPEEDYDAGEVRTKLLMCLPLVLKMLHINSFYNH